MTDAATTRQLQAALPDRSTWLTANAGSGKTRVLTQRVARLLLAGVPPQNVLCLTYTRAAAAEMQNRLIGMLGEWAMLADQDLAEALRGIGEEVPEDLGRARTLFAQAIETPGGLRIQTIHSFCASLLRRFPLEAGVSPVFAEMDERAARQLRQEVLESLAQGDGAEEFRQLARFATGADMDKLCENILKERGGLPANPDRATVFAQFGIPADLTEDRIGAAAIGADGPRLIAAVRPILAASGGVREKKIETALATLDPSAPPGQVFDRLAELILVKKTQKSAPPTKAVEKALGPLLDDWLAFLERIEQAFDQRARLRSAEKTWALHAFAAHFLPAYEKRKSALGWLDFDDLIRRATALLSDTAMAQWVLYRLDGGIDHILVDEAQDTSPAQWRVIELLAQEFTVGHGARADVARTLFVVGDPKQSIYSFQGADQRAFREMQGQFARRLGDVGQEMQQLSLEHSFRSSPAILRVADAVFSGLGNRGFEAVHHQAFFADLPGRVDIWPLLPPAGKQEKLNWYDPTDLMAPDDSRILLARHIAQTIRDMVQSETVYDTRTDGFRPVRYGDFLVLVQRRSPLFHEIIRSCKALGLPIAGADRLKIAGELAVRDLNALLQFLVTPDDDLSLAAVLRSPLFGLSEDALFRLAHGRAAECSLWQALARRRDDFAEAHEILTDLRDIADFAGPYELIERILTRHGGRKKLLARLGPEAEEGIDALLVQALGYETVEPPSITGFVEWLQLGDVEIKRQPDAAGDRIRVMTTHGAKGLEAPIVILPDTIDIRAPRAAELVVPDNGGAPIWKMPAPQQPDVVRQMIAAQRASAADERLRLLYVALTRAEKWLIICGAGKASEEGESWLKLVSQAFEALPHEQIDTPVGPGLRHQHGTWKSVPGGEGAAARPVHPALPDWARMAADPPRPRPRPLVPSNLAGIPEPFAGGGQAQAETARHWGTAVHRLLEILPDRPRAQWERIAADMLAIPAAEAAGVDPAAVLDEARQVLEDPRFAHVFGNNSLAEVGFSTDLAADPARRVHGTIDRLIVGPDTVQVVDFKSTRQVPEGPAQVSPAILAQMGAYLEAVTQIYPGKSIELGILWTAEPRLMSLPHDIVRQALRDTTVS